MKDLDIVMMKDLENRRKLNREYLKGQLENDKENNAKLIIREAKKLCGNYVDFYGCCGGYLLGATCGFDDYYWLYIDNNLKIRYSSCVGNPSLSDDIPNINYSVLDYLIRNDSESIIEKIKESFSKCDDIMMTPVYINGKEYIIEENM